MPPVRPVDSETGHGARSASLPDWLGASCAGVLAALTFVVHDVPYMLRQPYWLDEAWVALSTRVPFTELTSVTSATPIGWTALLRTVAVGGDQRQRLLPLVFAALTVLGAYALGRAVWARPVGGVLAGVLAAGTALLVPSALLRTDLKQYTADAFVAVLVLFVVVRLESAWSRPRLATLAAVGVLGMLVSHTTAFVASAALLAVALVQLVRRCGSRLLEACVAGVAAALGMGLVYYVFDRPHLVPSIRDYWAAFYLPWQGGWDAVAGFLLERAATVQSAGLGPGLLCVGLVTLGVVVLARMGRPAAALTIPVLLIELLVASAARLYPLLDTRTSHFLLTLLAVVAAIGVAGTVVLASRLHQLAGLGVAAVAIALFVVEASPYLRSHPIPLEDVRSQVRYVEANRQPQDVIIVDYGANFGFGYYFQAEDPELRPAASVATSFVVDYGPQSMIIVMSGRGPADVEEALAQARTLTARTTDGRIWIVRAHLQQPERRAWDSVLTGADVDVLEVGPDPLLLVNDRETSAPG